MTLRGLLGGRRRTMARETELAEAIEAAAEENQRTAARVLAYAQELRREQENRSQRRRAGDLPDDA